ncbi:MAG: toprim domain-containing protein [Bacteroidia bacterium]|nr:toprim domain-containing protein [Bacteroidia bacterium]
MLDSTLTTAEQLQILLDCIYANTGKEALLNGSQTKSTRNFHFIRSERTPSCSLFVKNGTPFIHDFGAGITYNYISAYAAAYNLSNNEAFKELMARYRPDEQSPARPQPPARRYQPPVLEVPAPDEVEEEPTDIEVSTELHPFEKAYFENLGISPALLAQYHIYGLRAYKKLSSTEGNPVFAIRVGESGYKIYQPKARDKAFKWFFVGKKPEGFNIYGLEQLSDRSGDLFITEGLKDTLSILAHTPYESIALDNAAIRPSAELIYALKARYQRLVLCFDLDDTGTQKPGL